MDEWGFSILRPFHQYYNYIGTLKGNRGDNDKEGMQWSFVYVPRRLTHLTAWPTRAPTNLLSEFRPLWRRNISPDISLFYSISLDVSQQISSLQYKSELDYTKHIGLNNIYSRK